MKYPILFLSFLLSLVSHADRGCEGNSYFEITYIERDTGEIFIKHAIGYERNLNSVGFMGGILSGIDEVLIITEELNKGGTYKIVVSGTTQSIDTNNSFPEFIQFIALTGDSLSYKNVRSILNVEYLGEGCDSIPYIVDIEDFETIRSQIPLKVRKVNFQIMDGVIDAYEVDYNKEDKGIIFSITPKGEGC